MKQIISTLGNQTLNGALNFIIFNLFRALMYTFSTLIAGFLIACFWLGMRDFFHRLPQAIETVKTVFF